MKSNRIAQLAATLAITAGLAVAVAHAQPPGEGPSFVEGGGLDAFAAPDDGGFGGGPGGPGYGGPHGPAGPGRPPGMDPRRVAQYLSLTEEQRASARQIFETQRERMRPMMEQQRALHDQLETLLDDPTASDASLAGLVKQIHVNRTALEASRKAAKARFVALLDAGQKAKLAQLESVMDGLGLGKRGVRGRRS